MSSVTIATTRGPLQAFVEATPSKSVTHRALVTAALARSPSTIRAPLDADDTRITRDALVALGVRIETEADRWIVHGRGAEGVRGGSDLWLGDSGTSARFLLAVASLGARVSRLDGSERMRERPMRELAAALETVGAAVQLDSRGGGLPARAGGTALRGGSVALPAVASSQFASAFLLIGSALREGVDLTCETPIVSRPYIDVTIGVLNSFGVVVECPAANRWIVRRGCHDGRDYRVEGDHSSASYFLAAAGIVGGTVRVHGLDPASHQPDACLGEILRRIGCRVTTGERWIEAEGDGAIRAFDVDLGDSPDLSPTVAVLGLFADGPCTIRGVAHLRVKESDRLEMLAHNLRALGRQARAVEDRLEIGPPPPALHGATIETASDHRLAMSFAVAGLRVNGLALDDAECVAKSNPGFWNQFDAVRTGTPGRRPDPPG